MANQLDLDTLVPESRTVKVNGSLYQIKPITLRDYLELQRILKKATGKSQEEQVEFMGEVFESMRKVVPDMDKMELTIQQAMALLQFIYQQEEQSNAPKADEKKTETSPTQ